jgi:hypothetical protein
MKPKPRQSARKRDWVKITNDLPSRSGFAFMRHGQSRESRRRPRLCRREKRQFEEERDRASRAADLEALRVLRDYLIFKANTRGFAHERLRGAIDDYAEEITGDRTALHAKSASIGR